MREANRSTNDDDSEAKRSLRKHKDNSLNFVDLSSNKWQKGLLDQKRSLKASFVDSPNKATLQILHAKALIFMIMRKESLDLT